MKHSTKRAALLAGLGLAPVGAALAAGMTTHAHIADLGRQALPEGALKTLLTQHRPSLLAGAIHPDGGYGSGAIFPEDGEMAERAHWEDFNDAFIAHLQNIGCSGEVQQLLVSRQPLGLIDLNGLSDRCGKLIAFAFGNAAHGITDETWDSLFEPVVRERDLSPESAAAANAKRRAGPSCRGLFGTPADEPALRRALEAEDEAALAATLPIGPVPGIEYAMDVVAIVEQNLWLDAPLPIMVIARKTASATCRSAAMPPRRASAPSPASPRPRPGRKARHHLPVRRPGPPRARADALRHLRPQLGPRHRLHRRYRPAARSPLHRRRHRPARRSARPDPAVRLFVELSHRRRVAGRCRELRQRFTTQADRGIFEFEGEDATAVDLEDDY